MQNDAFDVTIVFSEEVTDFVAEDIDFTGTATATATLRGSGMAYTTTITPSSDGNLGIQVSANVVHDDAGNPNEASTIHTVQVDTVKPTVTITDVPTTVQNDAFDVTINFSENVSDFVAEDINFTGTATATATLRGSGTTYTATITPSGDGNLSIQVPANVAHDDAGNPNEVSTIHTVQVDTVKPTVTIDVPSAVQNEAFDVTVEFSEPVTGFVQNELSVTGTAGATITNWAPQAGSTYYIATIRPISDGSTVFNIAANVTQDNANNGNTPATQKSVTLDITRPTVMITAVPTTVQNDAFDVTIAFSEAVSDFVAQDINFTGTATATATLRSSGTTYTARVHAEWRWRPRDSSACQCRKR